MGPGAIFIGRMAEMTIPTLLVYAVLFGMLQSSLQLRRKWYVVLSFYLVTLIASGLVHAVFYKQLTSGSIGMLEILLLPLVVSLLVIGLLIPKNRPSGS